jgi:hypothetical protein
MGLNTTAPSYTSGQVVTAAELNALQDGIQAAWASYSVAWTAATTNPSVGNGSLLGRYLQIGKTIDFSIVLTFGSTTNAGSGAWTFSLPVQAFQGQFFAFGAARIPGSSFPTPMLSNSTTFQLLSASGAAIGSGTMAWASGNVVTISGRYESA